MPHLPSCLFCLHLHLTPYTLTMPDLADIPGLSALRSHTKGDRRIKIAVLDGPVELERACFQGANLTRIDPYWAEAIEADSQDLETFLEIENSDKSDKEKKEMLAAAVPDENIRGSLYLRFHGNHIISVICGQPDSPVEGIAPSATVINIPIAYSINDGLNPLNISRAISTAIEQGANIIHCSVCHPTQSGIAQEFIDKAIRQAQQNNILIVAPAGNNKGECWCIPAVLDNVLAVGAMKDTGEPLKISNFGGKYATQGIIAPGENVLGAQPGTDEPVRKKGTSCATPIVTGVAALLMSLQLERGAAPDAEAVRAALTNSAIPCNPEEVEEPERCLLGRINIYGAYELLTGTRLTEETLAAEAIAGEVTSNIPLTKAPMGDGEALMGEAIAGEVTSNIPLTKAPMGDGEALMDLRRNKVPVQERSSIATVRAERSRSTMGEATEARTGENYLEAIAEDIQGRIAKSLEERIAANNTYDSNAYNSKSYNSSAIVASEISPSLRSNLIYSLGVLGYDFGTEARRDSFKQFMPAVTVGNTQVPANPYDSRQMVEYLEDNPWEAKSLIWTLNLELTPIYAIEPVGAFAANIYETMQYMLAGQTLSAGDEDYIERVSIPGKLTDKTVKLFSGQIVPVVKVNTPRGMYGWKVNTLIESALQAVSAEQAEADETIMRRSLTSFLNRVYYDLRNLGQMARDRALNFAATNAFQAVQAFSQAVANGMELDSINVEKSPFCRYGSDCWDVKLKFFDPENSRRAKKVFRFTIDVSDLTPVTLGEVRFWSVSQ
ncbi:MAG: PatA/PatG family cyanobactin maturation protease [Oscillatoria sp. SIO1A7]|nr:PatA/PatG family cyanobactin maturation protease [Oscillatoria sp. SIO1A7]